MQFLMWIFSFFIKEIYVLLYTWKHSSVLLLTLCSVNISTTNIIKVKTTPVNMRWFNFHFQPNINVKTTFDNRRWIDVILSTLFQLCFLNVETTSKNVRRLTFHFQPNINVETTSMNVDDQRCFNVDSALMCLLGTFLCYKLLKFTVVFFYQTFS